MRSSGFIKDDLRKSQEEVVTYVNTRTEIAYGRTTLVRIYQY